MTTLNPEHFIPQIFCVDITCGADRGQEGLGQISLNDRPFILTEIHHQIINLGRAASSVQEDQDGLYRLDFSLYQQRRYWSGSPPMADGAYGSIRHGIWVPLQSPLALEGNKTLHVRIVNEIDRQSNLSVQVQFHGVEDLRRETGVKTE